MASKVFAAKLVILLSLSGSISLAQAAEDYRPPAEKLELPAEQRTGTIKKVFVICHSHLDIGFTKPPDQVARDYKDQIDIAIRLVRENKDFRWTIESTWMLDEWLRRTDDQALLNELGQLLREGRIELAVTFGNMHTGVMAPEGFNRLVYLGERYRQRFGVEGSTAFQDDVPGFSWALPRVLASSKVKNLILGLNLGFGGGNSLGMGKDPYWWVGPDGSRVLTWFTYSAYIEGMFWKLTSLKEAEKAVPRRLAWLERNGYKYDAYLLQAAVGDNGNPESAYRVLAGIRDWNRMHSDLSFQMATSEEFFKYIVQKYGDRFPEVAGDSSGHWEFVKLTAPELAGKMREASNLLPAAETLASIISLTKGVAFPRFDFTEAWNQLLTYYEHTGGAAGPGWPGYYNRWETDWDNVAHYAASMSGYSDSVQQFTRALMQLAPSDETTRTRQQSSVIVYNGLSWERSGPVVVEGLPRELREGPVVVVDALTGQRQASEDVPGTKRQIVFWARDVPSIGYRLYRVEKGSPPSSPRPRNEPFRMVWDQKGSVTSIVDQESGQELLGEKSDRPFGGLYIAPGRTPDRLVSEGPAEIRTTNGAVASRVEFVRSNSPLPLEEFTLYREAPYVDIRLDVDLHALVTELRRTYSISFAQLSGGQQVFVDGAGFVMRVPQDILPGGAAPHLMPTHFTHWQKTDRWGVTLANREAFALRRDKSFHLASEETLAQTREEGEQRLFRTEPRGSPVQSFHFRIAAQREEPWEWERLGCELNLPLKALVVTGPPPVATRSFFELSQPTVQLLSLKPAEFRPGWYLLRLQEVGGKRAVGVKLVTPIRFVEAVRSDMVEGATDIRLDLNQFSVAPWETLSVLVRLE